MFESKKLFTNLKSLLEPHGDDSFIGVRTKDKHLEFFVQGMTVASIMSTPVALTVPTGMVNAKAMLAAVSAAGKTVVLEFTEAEHATLHVGRASLTMREAPDAAVFDSKLSDVPDCVQRIIAERLPDTFVPASPKSVFGWEIIVEAGIAEYGSANGPQAIYEYTKIPAKDYSIRFPHEAVVSMAKIIGKSTRIQTGKSLIVVHVGDVCHYIPTMADAPSLSLDDVVEIVKVKGDIVDKLADLKNSVETLFPFAIGDTKITFTSAKNKLVAGAASSVGETSVVLGETSKDYAFTLSVLQVSPITKYAANAKVSLSVIPQTNDKHKIKALVMRTITDRNDQVYTRYYMAAAS
jgi:hypothetical protein